MPLTDKQIDSAMRAWARDVLAGTDADPTLVTLASPPARSRRSRAWTAAVTASAAVVLAALTVVFLRSGDDGNESAGGTSGCPATIAPSPRPHQTGADGPLFARPVSSMVACTYSGNFHRDGHLKSVSTLPVTLARRLATAANAATTEGDDPLLCLTFVPFSVLVARDPNGTPMPPVELTPGCRQVAASNGSATRFLNSDDPAFSAVIDRIGGRPR